MPWGMVWASAEVRSASDWVQRWGGRQGTGVGGRGVTSQAVLKTLSRYFGDKGLGNAATIFVRPGEEAVARKCSSGVRIEVCCLMSLGSVRSVGLDCLHLTPSLLLLRLS